MIRTQIYIPETLHARVKTNAKTKKQTMAKLIRELIDKGLREEEKQRTKGLNALLKLKFRGGPKDLSANMDYYLYGEPKNKRK